MEVQWALVLFTVVSGTGAWLFAWSMIANLLKKGEAPDKRESIVSIVLLVIGGCLSVLHLKHFERILEALNHPTSGIFIEAALIGVLIALVAVYLVLYVRNASEPARKAIGIAIVALAAVFTFACGSSYMMEARPVWCTLTLPLAYCGTACAAGATLNLLMKAIAKAPEEQLAFASLTSLVGCCIGMVCNISFIIATGWATIAAPAAIAWTAVGVICLIAAILLSLLAWKRPTRALPAGIVALCATVVAAVAVRVTMWLIGSPILDFFNMPLS